MINPFESIDKRLSRIEAKLIDLEYEPRPISQSEDSDPLKDFIPRSEAKKVLNIKSNATLWRWDNAGKVKRYTMGGKVYYKRSELLDALTKSEK